MDIVASSEAASPPGFQFRIENFRLFKDSGWLDIFALTCIVGRNSSGKSSVIAALLLLKQSIENEVFGSAITPLALSGQYCDLGQYRDLVHNHQESSELSFSFRVPVSYLAESAPKNSGPLVTLATPRPEKLPQRSIFWHNNETPKSSLQGTVALRLTFSADEPFGPSLSKCVFTFSEHGSIRFVRTVTGERKQHWRTYVTGSIRNDVRFEPSTRSFFPIISFREDALEGASSAQRSIAREIVVSCRSYFRFIESLLAKSEMIGPFRQRPERRYTFGGFGASRSGPSGEQAVDLLLTESLVKAGEGPLQLAVSYWLRELKLLDSLRIRDVAKRKNLFEVDVKFGGSSVRSNLTDVGFGVSQVLPVIVQGLLMQRGGIYFVQEPEIHLHPDAQAGLADFFIYLAFQGVTSVIETHSEYMLLRLRRRLAEKSRPSSKVIPKLRAGRGPFHSSDVSVLFSHASHQEADITKLTIGPGFQFENLPVGFMSQISDDRMALLKAASKVEVG